MIPLLAAALLGAAAGAAGEPPSLDALVDSSRNGTGRELVAALAEKRIPAAEVWRSGASAAVLDVVFGRAAAGDCRAASAIDALAEAAPPPPLAERVASLLAGSPAAIRGCWPIYRRALPRVSSAAPLCEARAEALPVYEACACTSPACRELVSLLRGLACAGAPPAHTPAAGCADPAG